MLFLAPVQYDILINYVIIGTFGVYPQLRNHPAEAFQPILHHNGSVTVNIRVECFGLKRGGTNKLVRIEYQAGRAALIQNNDPFKSAYAEL